MGKIHNNKITVRVVGFQGILKNIKFKNFPFLYG